MAKTKNAEKSDTIKKAKDSAKKKAEKPVKAAKTAPTLEKSAEKVVEKPAKPPKEPKAPKVPTLSKAAEREQANLTEEANQLLKKWQKLSKQYADEKPVSYAITGLYDIKSLLTHKIHGWGIVLNRRENYIDVLFEGGMKTLIMNFKD